MVYLTKDELKKLHMIELELLLEFKRICEKYGIKYTIIGGTLLGAVRHGGFIPWDDDADVALLRKDYERFEKVVGKEIDTSRFYYQSLNRTPGYRWGYSKLRRKGTVFLRKDQEMMPYEQGVFLDIFPIDGTPNNKPLRLVHEMRCFFVRKALWAPVGKRTTKSIFIRMIYSILSRIPEEIIKKRYRKLILEKEMDNSMVVRTLTYPAPKPLHGYYRRWFSETEPIEFENHMFQGVKDYDGWLRYEFGDGYMELPPKNKRKIHPISKIQLMDE